MVLEIEPRALHMLGQVFLSLELCPSPFVSDYFFCLADLKLLILLPLPPK
jgi:hypothetical protein